MDTAISLFRRNIITLSHQIVATAATTKIIKSLRLTHNKEVVKDIVIYSPNISNAKYDFQWKNITNVSEYACNVKNCQYIISDGCSDTIADAFYNQKYCTIIPELFETESVINMLFADHYGYGRTAYNGRLPTKLKLINIFYNQKVEFLHQEVDKFFGM